MTKTVTLVNRPLHGRKLATDTSKCDGSEVIHVHHSSNPIRKMNEDQCVVRSNCSYVARYEIVGNYGYYKGEDVCYASTTY